ncbi:MAG: trigger factor, partial [Planctomycetes bacterium]|nr:trigger factor [Planctomycetota bacterium]
PKNPLKFDVTFEVKPTFEIADYKGLRLVRKSGQVTDKDVDDTVETLRERRAVLSVVEGATVEANDVIICNAEAAVGSEAAWKDDNIEVPVAANAVGPVSVPELSKSLAGAKTGETREIPVKLGPTFPKEEHRGKDAVLKVALSEIKRPVKPEANDDLAKQFGFDTLADLKTNLRRRIEVDKTAAVQRALEEQVKDRLLQKVDFELPADMLAREADRVLHRVQLRLQYRGVPWEEIEKNVEDLKKSSQEHAQREFRTYFILQEIADKEKIYATESEIEARVALMAQNYGVPAVKMHRRLESDGSLDELRVQMREDKTVAFLLEKAEIEDEAAPQKS